MSYTYEFSDDFLYAFQKVKKKDRILATRIQKKIDEIISNPEHFKPLQHVLKGKRRAHVGSFVILYEFKNNVVLFIKCEHHDNVYL
ncbi:type II toxin-antitoxin system mRNA interferase toxin, RelE/StbE family [Candidatus Woesearchaeota archaeon]|nr:type II toxin-antitoxin system mRNA interferase toxin, RelE/StbE family [Candidatus Woesearchaeota archaeon]